MWTAPGAACEGFAFDAELIAKAHKQRFTIVEVPITWSDKLNSNVGIAKAVLPMLRCMLKTRAELRR